MAVAAKISLEEYLNTSYRPDCDYVDGEVQERNLGQQSVADEPGTPIPLSRAHRVSLAGSERSLSDSGHLLIPIEAAARRSSKRRRYSVEIMPPGDTLARNLLITRGSTIGQIENGRIRGTGRRALGRACRPGYRANLVFLMKASVGLGEMQVK